MASWVRGLCLTVGFCCSFAFAGADEGSMNIAKIIAPSGHLRAAINYGNPVLAQKDPQTGEPRGVSAELARELGRRLGVPVDFVTYDAAGKVTDALQTDAWDVAFLAIDPVRSAGITYTAPYVLIEGAYLVPDGSPIRTNDDVDRAGVRVVVGRGSAYDLYLSRTLKKAQIIRVTTSADAMDAFERDHLEVAAGVKQPIAAYAAAHPGLRVLAGRFMVIEQAVGLPKARDAGLPYVRAFVEDMKASGFVAKALAASGQADATVAPASPYP
jgi:polar amino acid transport system substrate-binding protein